jgi:predicted acetyltransferase
MSLDGHPKRVEYAREVEDKVAIRAITAEDAPLVERLWQLYVHDLSESRGSLPNSEGLFKLGHLQWFRDMPVEWPGFLITYGGAPAGFAFVGINWAGGKRTIGEFFVVRGARRRGIGEQVARQLIGRYPGAWEIAFQDNNPGAPEFWKRVVGGLVGAAWREEWRPVPDKPEVAPDHWLVFETP